MYYINENIIRKIQKKMIHFEIKTNTLRFVRKKYLDRYEALAYKIRIIWRKNIYF